MKIEVMRSAKASIGSPTESGNDAILSRCQSKH